MNSEDGKEMVDVLRARLSVPKVEPLAAAGTAHTDIIAQIKQLGELKEAGVLSQEEFEAEKAELLR